MHCVLYQINVLKTYQFKSHCKGDSHSPKTANIILPGLVIKQSLDRFWSDQEVKYNWKSDIITGSRSQVSVIIE